MATIGESKRNSGERTGERLGSKNHGKYYELYESIGHDTIECTMLRRE